MAEARTFALASLAIFMVGYGAACGITAREEPSDDKGGPIAAERDDAGRADAAAAAVKDVDSDVDVDRKERAPEREDEGKEVGEEEGEAEPALDEERAEEPVREEPSASRPLERGRAQAPRPEAERPPSGMRGVVPRPMPPLVREGFGGALPWPGVVGPLFYGGTTAVELRGVAWRIDGEVNIYIPRLRGWLLPTGETPVPDFDRPSSFVIAIEDGVIAIMEDDFSDLLNRYAFNYDGAPVGDVVIDIDRGRLTMTAMLRRRGVERVLLRGYLEPTFGGDIAFFPTSMEAAGVPVGSLFELFEEEAAARLSEYVDRGVTVEGEVIVFDPERLFPAPRFQGDVFDVRVEDNRVVMLLDGPGDEEDLDRLVPPGKPQHYVFFRGGELKLGKLYMSRADLLFYDLDTSDPFTFYFRDYARQLFEGDVDVLPDLGLSVGMADYGEEI